MLLPESILYFHHVPFLFSYLLFLIPGLICTQQPNIPINLEFTIMDKEAFDKTYAQQEVISEEMLFSQRLKRVGYCDEICEEYLADTVTGDSLLLPLRHLKAYIMMRSFSTI